MSAIRSVKPPTAIRARPRAIRALALALLVAGGTVVFGEVAALYVAVRTLASLIAQTLG